MASAAFFEALKETISGFSTLLGKETEIVLHDLRKRELIFIVNGEITGRKIGYKLNPSIYDTIMDLADENGRLVGYGSHSPNGKNLRSSHFIIHDEDGEPAALICVNQDTSKWEEMRSMIDQMIQRKSMGSEEVGINDDNYIQKITQKLIVDTIEKAKPSSLDTKEEKMDVLQKLEVRGIFAVKDAVPIVCRMLSISQATFYNYLREIRSHDAKMEKNTLHL